MQLELGQHLLSSDGQDVGAIKHLILDPANGQVKTFVVEKGWFLPVDIEIPLEAVQEKGGDGLCIQYTAEEVKRLPHFDASQYTSVPPQTTIPVSSYPFGGLLWPNGYPRLPLFTTGDPLPAPVVDGEVAAVPPQEVQERLRLQDEENAVISAGDAVFSQDGEKVGEVENIAFDSATGRPTHLTVRRGWLFHKDWELSADAIASVDDGIVTLSLGKRQLQTRQEDERFSTEGRQTNQTANRR